MAESGNKKSSKKGASRVKRRTARLTKASLDERPAAGGTKAPAATEVLERSETTQAAPQVVERSEATQAAPQVVERDEVTQAAPEQVAEAAPLPVEGTFLERLMKVSPFRAKVISRIVEKMQS